MAENARSERQLIRQRGAGDRDIAPANFDFNFGADSREDRQLMRQRGAGTRQVDAIDFGFHFATPSTVRSQRFRGVSQSPATVTRENGRIRKTPDPVSGLLPPPSLQSVRSQGSRSAHGGSPPRKRRRLSEISNMSRASSVPLPFAGYSHELPVVSDIAEQAVQQREIIPSSPLFFSASKPDISSTADKENDSSLLSNVSKKSNKKRKRKSIGQQSMRSKKRRTSSLQPLPTPPETQEGSVQTTEAVEETSTQTFPSNRPNRQSRRWSVESREPDSLISIKSSLSASKGVPPELDATLDHPSVETDAFTQPNSRLSEGLASISEIPVTSIEEDAGIDASEDEAEAEVDASALPFDVTTGNNTLEEDGVSETPNGTPEPNTGFTEYASDGDEQPSDTSPPAQATNLDVSHIDNDEDADEDYAPDQNLPTKVVKRRLSKQKPSHSRRSRTTSTQPSKQRQRRKPGIPILTYRITNVGRLPTIDEAAHEDENDSDANEFTRAPPAFTSRKSGNAVDVLRQACVEAISIRIEELQDSDLSRAELKNCTIALQSFNAALNTHLFQVSQALDHRLNLEARVRESRKEKAALQARWHEIRRQRDRIDLQKDEIRRQCWESKILDEKRFQASQAAFALENAVAREEEESEEDMDMASTLELRLRILAKDVSSQAGGGILQDLRKFNALLESLASTLS